MESSKSSKNSSVKKECKIEMKWNKCEKASYIPELRKKATNVCSHKWRNWSFTHHMYNGFWCWHFSEPIILYICLRIFLSDCWISQTASIQEVCTYKSGIPLLYSTRLYASVSNLLSSSIIAPHCSSVGERSPFSSIQAANFWCRSWLRLPVASRMNFFYKVSHA